MTRGTLLSGFDTRIDQRPVFPRPHRVLIGDELVVAHVGQTDMLKQTLYVCRLLQQPAPRLISRPQFPCRPHEAGTDPPICPAKRPLPDQHPRPVNGKPAMKLYARTLGYNSPKY